MKDRSDVAVNTEVGKRQAYVTPQLTVLGSVTELTQGGRLPQAADGGLALGSR